MDYKKKNKIEEKEEDTDALFEEFESQLPPPLDEEEEPENYDSLSDRNCDICGVRLTREEFENFEAECSECLYQGTQGLIDYDPD